MISCSMTSLLSPISLSTSSTARDASALMTAKSVSSSLGVISTTVSVFVLVVVRLENSHLTPGILPSTGTPARPSVVEFFNNPPMKMDCPLFTTSWVETSVVVWEGMPFSSTMPLLTSG